MLFGKKKKTEPTYTYDKETQIPVLHCSICNGEQVFGFKDKATGRFDEVGFVRNESELRELMKQYGVDSVTKEY